MDAVIRYNGGRWEGADAPDDRPRWAMLEVKDSFALFPDALIAVKDFCLGWAKERPRDGVFVVYGPDGGGWFLAVCKRTRSSLGCKSIAFVFPAEGPGQGRSLYEYSRSVNWLEHRTAYDFFPRLPKHLQEIIEEMTASEHLCPFQEFDYGETDAPEYEFDNDMELDYREIG